ncbi:pre-toxin TG domain-containing protein [Bacillus sp. UMB0728]|uniref:pre-toxin TG domain-containing protein n=1 Tax=Bacillus sp. UMB0728 TaxID=2066052 RepID=UPI00115978F6|nr:pre-toxin TG domain-containing protein [Bacillus sp. UMB0728]
MNKHTIKYLAAFLAFVLFLTAYIPGVYAGSKFSPGTFSPGTFSPGTFDPGQFDPGTFSPGTFDPGEFDPGTTSPGTVEPGNADSGVSSPGKGSPGETAPGQFTPDDFNFESNFDHDKLEGGDPDASGSQHGSSEQLWKLPGYEGGNESNDYQNPSLKEFLTDSKHIKDYLSRVGKGLKDTGKGLWDDAVNTADYLFSEKFASDVKSGFNDGYDFIANGGLKKKLSEGLDYVSSGKMLADAKGKASEWGDSGKRVAKYLFSKDSVKDFGDYVFSGEIAMDFAEDFEAFATGVDPETKERLGGGQRFLSLAGIAVKPVKVLDKAGKIADAGNKANKKANLADNGKKDRGKAAVASKDDSKSSDKDQIKPTVGDTVGNGKGIDKTRPSWRQSEIDVENDFPEYNAQKSFKDGKEVPYGEKGSSRPDLYQTGHSIEVKNYKITTSSGRSRLVNNVSKQVEKRLSDLPNGTKQSVIIDIRGQNVSDEILDKLYEKIMNKTNGKVDIRFKTN